MSAENLLLALSTLLFLAGIGITYWMHDQYRLEIVVSPTARPEMDGTMISVIVPARNEARNIRRCVQALLAQGYPNYELIIVDDRSNDETPTILAELRTAWQKNNRIDPSPNTGPIRFLVLEGQEPPKDWAGKPYALFQGVQQAGGDWLCFVDADTFLAPQCLPATLASARRQKADLFSMLTGQELCSFWEKAILPLVFTALSVGFPAERVNDPEKPEAIANGQFILIRRSVYQAIGGHEAVRDQIAEDKALAERVKSRGFRLTIADGRAVAQTRMYTRFSEIWEGWTKNIFLGMRDQLGLLLFGAVVGLVAALVLPVWLVGGAAWFLLDGTWQAAVVTLQALLLWAYLLWQRVQAARAFEISSWYALTLPLGAMVFTAMMFTSAYQVLSGAGVTWKGRRYAE